MKTRKEKQRTKTLNRRDHPEVYEGRPLDDDQRNESVNNDRRSAHSNEGTRTGQKANPRERKRPEIDPKAEPSNRKRSRPFVDYHHRRHSSRRLRQFLREEKREYRRDLKAIESTDQKLMELLQINENLRQDNVLVGNLITALHRLADEQHPVHQLLLAQHILYETHRYTLKLLQDEVFFALRRELEAELPRDYILRRLILEEDNDESGVDLDQLVDHLRVLPVDQLLRLLQAPTET